MTLDTHEFIRRFLIHVLPKGSTASATTASSATTIAKPLAVQPRCSEWHSTIAALKGGWT